MIKIKRNYPQNGYASVTEALGCLRKIGLEMWFKYNTAAFCDEKSKKGLQVGTDVHDLIEKHINLEEMKVDTEYPEEVLTAIKSFMLFKRENPTIKLKFSEIQGTSEKYQFNFTVDCAADYDVEIVADWKTGECKDKEKPTIYDEHLYQVSAYVKGLNEIQNKDIKKACVVSFAKDKIAYNIQWLSAEEIDEYFNEAFLPALTICKLQKRKKEEAKKLKKELKNANV